MSKDAIERSQQMASGQTPTVARPTGIGKFVRAERRKKKLRLALAGPSGSGKTLSALIAAHGIGGRIAVIDTEQGSASMYADDPDLDLEFDTLVLSPPYSPSRYIEAIKCAEAEGFDVLIIDSLSHAWAGEGGALEMHDAATAASRSKNSYVAWREVTPQHNALVGAILSCKCHVIATLRSKTEYVQDGKEVKKVGMEAIQRQGMEYEFDMVLDVENTKHLATPSKTRIKMFDGQHFLITRDTGRQIVGWLNAAKADETPSQAELARARSDKFSAVPDLSKFGVVMPGQGEMLIGVDDQALSDGLAILAVFAKRLDLSEPVRARAQEWIEKYQAILTDRLIADGGA